MLTDDILRVRLEERSVPITETGCLLWLGSVDTHGYGVFGEYPGERRAHRIAYRLRYGSIPKGLFVCHKCDVPSCINTDHLFLGTAKDNSVDMVKKGRQKTVGRKLNRQQIKEIRESILTLEELRKLYGVTQQAIVDIKAYKTWRDGPRKKWKLKPRTHCKRGHLFTKESTYIDPKGNQNCRICWGARVEANREKIKIQNHERYMRRKYG